MSAQDDTGTTEERVDLATRLRGVVLIAAALILVGFSWTHRPLELRNFGEATQAELSGDWVLKTPFYYGSFIVAAGLVVVGARALLKRTPH
jgi:hypothetical protein